MSKDARREQLLDTAAGLLMAQGPAALTMERLAAQAGVSKALPYLHFADSDDVLVELHRRELQRVTDRVAAAVTTTDPSDGPEALFRSAMAAYLDVIEERGDVLAVLRAPGSPAMKGDPGDRSATQFVATLLTRFGLSKRAAAVGAAALYGALNGLVQAWALGAATRAEVEATVLGFAKHLAESPAGAAAASPRRRERTRGTSAAAS